MYEARTDRHIIVTKYKVPGLTIQHMHDMNKDGLKNQEKMSNRLKNWVLEVDEDNIRTIIIKIQSPPLVSNRCMVSTLYHYVKKDGTYCAV